MQTTATPSEGGCLCGAVRYSIAAEAARPFTLTYCHCSMCRKATGGAFAAFVSIGREHLRWTAVTPRRIRSSPVAARAFCEACGSPLYYDGDAEDHVALAVGSLDDAADVRPDHHYGVESRLPWVDCGPDLPGKETTERFEGQP